MDGGRKIGTRIIKSLVKYERMHIRKGSVHNIPVVNVHLCASILVIFPLIDHKDANGDNLEECLDSTSFWTDPR